MFLVASLVFTNTLIASDFQVTWYFDSSSCKACHHRQLVTMEKYFRKGDVVIILSKPGEVSDLDVILENRFGKVEHKAGDRHHTTGFEILDFYSGELVSFQAKSGTYNVSRTDYLLRLFRDPRDSTE